MAVAPRRPGRISNPGNRVRIPAPAGTASTIAAPPVPLRSPRSSGLASEEGLRWDWRRLPPQSRPIRWPARPHSKRDVLPRRRTLRRPSFSITVPIARLAIPPSRSRLSGSRASLTGRSSPVTLIEVLVFFQEVRYVQKRIALQAQIDEGRLHAGKHARHTSFMNTAGERILIGALEVNFHQLIVFDQRHSGLVPIGRDHQFLTHISLLPAVLPRGD